MERHGTVVSVHTPKPRRNGETQGVSGFGKVYIRFNSTKDAEKARHEIYKRKFNGRFVDSMYYPDEKFDKGIFD